jgi:hypothetical protein
MAQAVSLENTSPPPTTLPYPPSWFDHLKAWVDRLPIPFWLFYQRFLAP